MATRLLPKPDLARERANERKTEIDQGLALARKVDALRETSATEEAKLARFRAETLESIRNDMNDLSGAKRALEGQISGLEARRAELLKPLDSEWAEVREKESELTRYALELQERLDYLREGEKDLQVRIEQASYEEKRISDRRGETVRLLAQAEENKQKSAQILAESSRLSAISEAEVRERYLEASRRETEIAVRERNLQLESRKVEKEWKRIEITRIQLQDQRETLERALSRKP